MASVEQALATIGDVIMERQARREERKRGAVQPVVMGAYMASPVSPERYVNEIEHRQGARAKRPVGSAKRPKGEAKRGAGALQAIDEDTLKATQR